jgi:hypothetical protein
MTRHGSDLLRQLMEFLESGATIRSEQYVQTLKKFKKMYVKGLAECKAESILPPTCC